MASMMEQGSTSMKASVPNAVGYWQDKVTACFYRINGIL